MAAYGTLLSLSHTLRQVLHPSPLNNIIVDQHQIHLLLDKVNFFINFLEDYPRSQRNEEIERVERRIADAANAAEDIIESNVGDQIHAAKDIVIDSSDQIHVTDGEKFSAHLSHSIQTELEKFISIEKVLPMMMVTQGLEGLQLKISTDSTRSLSGGKKITMVGFGQHLEKIMSELASDEPSRRVIPIVGMGGIGKTTLATAVYKHPYIIEYFDVRAWVTVSQEYTVAELLNEINKAVPDELGSSGDDLGLKLHKKLFGRRYLIVMDDVWDVEALEDLKRFLPPNENGSRVLVTSRLSYLTDDLGSIYKMDFLDEGHSWDLLRKTIFGEEDCPVELEKIGKEIAKGCSGLPLTLVLIGGVLSKSERIREHWEYFFARDMTSALNSGNDEQVMKILSLSYTHLPVHLKPCFLYLSLFPEDFKIRVTRLVGLWVAEGLIKPTQDRCLEEVAHEYVEDLISRNVMMVDERGSRGNVKSCKLHDRVRDLCITEAAKQEFVYISKLDNPPIISPPIEIARRLSVSTNGKPLEITIEALRSAILNRSLFWASSTSETEPSSHQTESYSSAHETESSAHQTEFYSSAQEMESSAHQTESYSSAHETESSAHQTESYSSAQEMESSAQEMESSSSAQETESSAHQTESSSSAHETEYSALEMESSMSGMEAFLVDGEKVNQLTDIINSFMLLKVVHVNDHESSIQFLNLCNLRNVFAPTISSFLPMTLCWNLQTIILYGDQGSKMLDLPVEIWQMPQLRHLRSSEIFLPDLPDGDQNAVVLENLHTLGIVYAFKCSEQVLKRIPNLRKLRFCLLDPEIHCLKNLACLKKLESLGIWYVDILPTSIAFPVSLKTLDLEYCSIPWAYLSTVVGSLPNLEVLKLHKDATEGNEWNPIEGKFSRLKFLMISSRKLKIWGAEKEHFPCLECLVLRYMKLEEIPMSFAEILTLETIKLHMVKESLRASAREISEEREQLGYGPLILL